ncbi:MAG: ATP-binding cassette domain-containing protein, partial [Pseudomonadota bacterium]
MSVLAVDGLSKAYGALQAVDEVSFALAPGEIAALIGPNGAGKSTLFDMLTGRRRADSGVVRLEGRRLDRLTPRAIARAGVARTFQVTATYPSMTVVENVQIALIAKAGRVFSLLP